MSPTVTGRPLSPAEQQKLSDLQALFSPADALKRVDDFAKWIFTSIAVVGTLGAAFSNSAFGTLMGEGKVVFGIAILLVGASLFASTLALEPEWVHANPSSQSSMVSAVNENLRRRRVPIRCAAALFGLALVAAATAPLVSVSTDAKKPSVILGYELKPDGKFTGTLSATGLKPHSVVELRIEGAGDSKLSLAPSTRKTADAHGELSMSIELENVRDAGSGLKLSSGWADSPLEQVEERLPHPQTLSVLLPPSVASVEQQKRGSANAANKMKPSTKESASAREKK
jgi:hypothetical protein